MDSSTAALAAKLHQALMQDGVTIEDTVSEEYLGIVKRLRSKYCKSITALHSFSAWIRNHGKTFGDPWATMRTLSDLQNRAIFHGVRIKKKVKGTWKNIRKAELVQALTRSKLTDMPTVLTYSLTCPTCPQHKAYVFSRTSRDDFKEEGAATTEFIKLSCPQIHKKKKRFRAGQGFCTRSKETAADCVSKPEQPCIPCFKGVHTSYHERRR